MLVLSLPGAHAPRSSLVAVASDSYSQFSAQLVDARNRNLAPAEVPSLWDFLGFRVLRVGQVIQQQQQAP